MLPAGQQQNRRQDQLSQAPAQAAVRNTTLKWKGPSDRSLLLLYSSGTNFVPGLKLGIFGKETLGNFTGKNRMQDVFSTRLAKTFLKLL